MLMRLSAHNALENYGVCTARPIPLHVAHHAPFVAYRFCADRSTTVRRAYLGNRRLSVTMSCKPNRGISECPTNIRSHRRRRVQESGDHHPRGPARRLRSRRSACQRAVAGEARGCAVRVTDVDHRELYLHTARSRSEVDDDVAICEHLRESAHCAG
jgi:hypothetical protein